MTISTISIILFYYFKIYYALYISMFKYRYKMYLNTYYSVTLLYALHVFKKILKIYNFTLLLV